MIARLSSLHWLLLNEVLGVLLGNAFVLQAIVCRIPRPRASRTSRFLERLIPVYAITHRKTAEEASCGQRSDVWLANADGLGDGERDPEFFAISPSQETWHGSKY